MHDSYESVTEGEQFDLGSYTLEREEMLSFALSYDPQSYHLDEDDDSMFDGVEKTSGSRSEKMTKPTSRIGQIILSSKKM
jgi:hypothetical protein